jgi:hypothetical protein
MVRSMIRKISFGFLVVIAFIASAFFFRAEQTAQAATNYCTTNFSINQCMSQLFSQQAHATPNYCTPQYGVNQCLNQIFPGGIFSLIVGTTPITNGTTGNCLYDNAGILGEQACGGGGGTPGNPTATAGPAAINGVATTYMRSDAAPAIQKATASLFGLVEVDNVTITAAGGVISAVQQIAANPTATAGPNAINGSAPTLMRSDSAPAIQKGSASQFGIVEVDGVTITASGGVISAVGGGGAVSSVTGTAGQITVSPTTGAVVVSLPSNITQTENFSATGHVFGAVNTGTATITVTNQTATLPAPSETNGIQIIGSGTGASNVPGIEMVSYGAFTASLFKVAGGTIGTPAATAANKGLGNFSFYGYDLTNAFSVAAQYQIIVQGSAFSATNHGTLQEWSNTPLNSTSLNTVMVLYQGLWVGSGTGSSDPGIGNLRTTGYITPSSGFTVATLPAAPPTGSRAYVTDAVACTFLAAITGGGTTYCPVNYTGAAWQGG